MRIIAGSFGGRTLKTVDGPGYRPATGKVRGALFSMLEARGVVWSGVRVLDLFAGSGSLGFEALSRGALETAFVEKEPRASTCLTRNAETMNVLDRCRVLEQDVAKFIRTRPYQPFEVIFIDPPYGEGRLAPTLTGVMRGGWLNQGGFVVAEVEHTLRCDPEAMHPDLELILDRTYGQTRIMVWQQQTSV